MATTGVSSSRKTNPRGIMSLLSSAACEWFLIFLLFVDSAFSCLLMRFAEYCELPTPCLFCSRSGKRKRGYYRSFLCRNHQEEISSLVSCQVHGNLADVREMCEECFTPFSTQNKLNSGSYRVLAGKLGLDIERHGVQSLILHRKFLPSPSGIRMCSCCNKSWGEKSAAQKFLQLTPVGFGASKANVRPPLPRVPGRSRFSRRDSFKKLRDKFSGPSSPKAVAKSGGNTLSHVGYSELKVHSDSESEVPFSDDDDGSSAYQGRNDMMARYEAQHRRSHQPKVQTDDVASNKPSHQPPTHVASLLDQPSHLDLSKHQNMSSLASDAFSAHGLEELNWEQPHPRPSIQARPELISLNHVSEPLVGASRNISQSSDQVSHMSSFSILSEYFSQKNRPIPFSPNVEQRIDPASSNVIGNLMKSISDDKGNTSLLAKQSVNAQGFSPSMSNDVNQTNSSAGVDNQKEVLDGPVGPLSIGDSSKFEDMTSVPQVYASAHDKSQRVSNDEGNTSLLPKNSINKFSNISSPSMSNDVNPTNISARVDIEREVSDGPVEPLSAGDSSKVEPVVTISAGDSSKVEPVVPLSAGDSSKVEPVVTLSAGDSSKVQPIVPLSAGDSSKVEPVVTLSAGDSSKVEPAIPLSAGDSSRVEPVVPLSAGDSSKVEPVVPLSAGDSSKVEPVVPLSTGDSSKVESVVPPPEGDSSKVENANSMPQISAPDHDESQRVSHDKGNTSLLAKNEKEFLNNATPSMSNDNKSSNASTGVDHEREASDRPTEPLSYSDSSKIEDANSMLQVSASNPDESQSQRGYASSSDGTHIPTLASSGRNDSGAESLDGVSVGDSEVESVVDKLKQRMNSLYKELEEERSAAAIAANQAMAMINRLQEEKAALHMEALQYLRMMDEQAEYDMEALEKANDLLSEKEKEMQDLEAELEYYRNSFQGNEAVIQDPPKKISSLQGKTAIIADSESSKLSKASDVPDNINSSVSNFEDEKLYLVQYLKKLERRMRAISGSGGCSDDCNGGNSEQKPTKVDNQENLPQKPTKVDNQETLPQKPTKVDNQENLPTEEGNQIDHNKEADGFPMQNGSSASNESSDQDKSANLVEDCKVVSEENNHISNSQKKLSSSGGEINMANLENEVAFLSDRLQALETDRDFLNHAFGVLQSGNDGLQFIQEIVLQLQELRKKEFEKRSLSVP